MRRHGGRSYGGYAHGHRVWRWVAGIAAAVLLAALTTTAVIVNGGDSGATAGRVAPPPTRTVIATPGPHRAAPPPAADPRAVVYSVSGIRQPGDLVTIVYTDESGSPRTDHNVTLPWSRTLILDPDVEVNSVTATSFASQLNCAITDALGSTVASQSYNTSAATCYR